jgi:peptidoglycan/LPS O-acetylase OafA/YrhL
MSDALSLLGYICVAVAMDWLFVTKIGSHYTDFDHRYWPFSRLRWVGFAGAVLAAIYAWEMTGTNAPLPALIPCGILILIYVATALADVNAQRRVGYKKPSEPRYSDGEYGS